MFESVVRRVVFHCHDTRHFMLRHVPQQIDMMDGHIEQNRVRQHVDGMFRIFDDIGQMSTKPDFNCLQQTDIPVSQPFTN
jgi:hypothetical protein